MTGRRKTGPEGHRRRVLAAGSARAYRTAAGIEDWNHLRSAGLTIDQAIERLGFHPDTALEYEALRDLVPPWPPQDMVTRTGPRPRCGTMLGFHLHATWQEPPCPDCHLVRYPDRASDACGTLKGYQLHQDHGESPCGRCMAAHYPGLMNEDVPVRAWAEMDLVAPLLPEQVKANRAWLEALAGELDPNTYRVHYGRDLSDAPRDGRGRLVKTAA